MRATTKHANTQRLKIHLFIKKLFTLLECVKTFIVLYFRQSRAARDSSEKHVAREHDPHRRCRGEVERGAVARVVCDGLAHGEERGDGEHGGGV